MNHPYAVYRLIKDLCKLNGLDFNRYFEDTAFPESTSDTVTELNIDAIRRAAEILGENTEDILAADTNRTGQWSKRFPFIPLLEQFNAACKSAYFSDNGTRYDYENVKERLYALLREIDRSAPGTYHRDAFIRKIYINTANYCHFEPIHDLMNSFFEMVERAETLFFKAWKTDLTPEEINEYNIIVSVLNLYDKQLTPAKDPLFYSILKKLIPVYRAENGSRLFDYLTFDPNRTISPLNFAPWRCIEFVQDKELVQKYVDLVPDAKKHMRLHALETANFECHFTWSDAEPLILDPDSISDSIEDISFALQIIKLQNKFDGLSPTRVFVPKTPSELGEDQKTAALLMQLAGSVAKGGVRVPPKKNTSFPDLQKLSARIHAAGGAFYE